MTHGAFLILFFFLFFSHFPAFFGDARRPFGPSTFGLLGVGDDVAGHVQNTRTNVWSIATPGVSGVDAIDWPVDFHPTGAWRRRFLLSKLKAERGLRV